MRTTTLAENVEKNGRIELVPKDEARVIQEMREILRGGIVESIKTKEQKRIDALLEETSYRIQVAACETEENFLQLFALHKIEENVWRNAGNLARAGYQKLQRMISVRFANQGGWSGFLAFMGQRTKRKVDKALLDCSYTEQVAACETREDFLRLFELHGIREDVWKKSSVLAKTGYKGLFRAIFLRFQNHGRWAGFLRFMFLQEEGGIDKKVLKLSFVEQVAACETREDFLKLFELHGLKIENCRNSVNIKTKGYNALYVAISNRFRDEGGWAGFLRFMFPRAKGEIDREILKLSFVEQVAACETREDFLKLFELHGIHENIWRRSQRLQNECYPGLYVAVRNRFRHLNGWQGFVDFMDGKTDAMLEEKIEKLNLEDAVVLLAHQPSKLRAYLSISHPELLPEEVDQLVSHSFRNLHNKRAYAYDDFEEKLESCVVKQYPKRTMESAAEISGTALNADTILFEGDVSTRRVKVHADGSFLARVPLNVGSRNAVRMIPLNHEKKQLGTVTQITIHQTGTPDDIEALVELLGQMGKDALEEIRTDPGRHEYVVQQAEQVLIRKFSGSFHKGKAYVEKLIENAKSSAVRKVLKAVLKRFAAINQMEYPNVKKDSPLYFFQKYCVAEIQRRIDAGERGVVLANDPGLGKTRTALVAVNGDPATIITPNSVVTSWTEEAQKALQDADILALQDLHSQKRKELLRTSNATHCVTNVEFLRGVEGDERYDLLSNEETIVVQDEAHGLLNLGTEQSKGARRLKSKFLLLLSATPCKDPKTLRRILHILEPDDERFQSDKAFMKAFPSNDPKSLKTLNVMKQKYMIRFTKEDVLEEMDPSIAPEKQKHRLPRKEHVPENQMGGYTLLEDQCQAMYELMLNFPQWSKQYDRYVPKDEIARLDQLRGNSNALVKTHALRQTANNPRYVGSRSEHDPKAEELVRCVETFLKEKRKVVIFCQYNAQALKYAELLKKHNPSTYTGLTSKAGYRADPNGQEILYRKNAEGSWALNANGFPIEDANGERMSALDYERITFQNASNRDVIITTYSMGAVGVTFTAGKATIFDDLPRDCVEEIQAEDRTHRIDHEHQTHHSVKYTQMIAHYPQAFLDRMKNIWVRKNDDGTYDEVRNQNAARRENLETAYQTFFAQGTFDEVRLAGLKTQRTRFRLINDGIDSESELPEIKDIVS